MAATMFERKRLTGRTSRMIDEAIRLARDGRAVYVIAMQFQEIQRIIDDRFPGSGIKVEQAIPEKFDWYRMRPWGANSNCVWLIDHYIIEARFEPMIREWCRFDATDEQRGATDAT